MSSFDSASALINALRLQSSPIPAMTVRTLGRSQDTQEPRQPRPCSANSHLARASARALGLVSSGQHLERPVFAPAHQSCNQGLLVHFTATRLPPVRVLVGPACAQTTFALYVGGVMRRVQRVKLMTGDGEGDDDYDGSTLLISSKSAISCSAP